jgi:hypothetical protein
VVRRARQLYERQEAAIEIILEHPEKPRREQAALLGLSPVSFNRIIDSDGFDALRQERLAQLIDPALKAKLEQGLLNTAIKAVSVVSDKLDIEPNMREALETVKVTTQALGLHNRKDAPVVQNNIQIAWLPAQG